MKVKLTELDDTDPEQEKWAESAAAARQTWRHLGLRLRSTTPASVVRLALILSALGSIAWLVWGTWPALLPFLILAAIFSLGFAGLAYSFYPYVVPDRLTIWDAASATDSLAIILVGTLFVLPVIIGYSFYAYRVFGGKATDLGYH